MMNWHVIEENKEKIITKISRCPSLIALQNLQGAEFQRKSIEISDLAKKKKLVCII